MTNEKTPEPKKNKEPSEQALLTEYEVLQQDSNAMIRTHWTVVGTFLPVSTGLLAWFVQSIASGNIDFKLINSLILTIFSLSMVLITGLLICWLRRVNSLVRGNNKTMKKIECLTNMEKRCKPNGIKGESIITTVYLILIALWIFVIIVAWALPSPFSMLP